MSAIAVNPTCSVVMAVLPSSLRKRIAQKDVRFRDAACATSQFVANVILGTVKAIRSGDFKSFDPNPGDAGCQSRAAILHFLLQDPSNMKELEALEEKARTVIDIFRKCKNNLKEQDAAGLFQREVESIEISEDMAFLMNCYFLQVLRHPCHKPGVVNPAPNGVLTTESKLERLALLYKDIDRFLYREERVDILNEGQSRVSFQTAARMKGLAEKVASLPFQKRADDNYALSGKHLRIHT